MAKIYLTKNEHPFYLKFGKRIDEHGIEEKAILAYEKMSDKLVGILYFEYIGDEGYLHNIKILDPEYVNLGVGTKMIRGAEIYLKKFGVKRFYGLYRPNGFGKEITPYFYQKNGYKKAGFLICKELDGAGERALAIK